MLLYSASADGFCSTSSICTCVCADIQHQLPSRSSVTKSSFLFWKILSIYVYMGICTYYKWYILVCLYAYMCVCVHFSIKALLVYLDRVHSIVRVGWCVIICPTVLQIWTCSFSLQVYWLGCIKGLLNSTKEESVHASACQCACNRQWAAIQRLREFTWGTVT